MGYGDEIIAAGQAEKIFARTGEAVAILDITNQPRWHPIWDGNPAILHPSHINGRAAYPSIISAPHARPYIIYPFTATEGWTFNHSFRCRDHLARIYLTNTELGFGAAIRARLGDFVLIEPWSKHENLRWPLHHWIELVRRHKSIRFVQHTHDDSQAFHVAAPNVTYVRASFREACGLLLSSRLYIRGESGMCHAAAALGVPQLTIWGGCMDWEVMGGYPKQVGAGVAEPPCGSWRPCAHCADIMHGISAHYISDMLTTVLRGQVS